MLVEEDFLSRHRLLVTPNRKVYSIFLIRLLKVFGTRCQIRQTFKLMSIHQLVRLEAGLKSSCLCAIHRYWNVRSINENWQWSKMERYGPLRSNQVLLLYSMMSWSWCLFSTSIARKELETSKIYRRLKSEVGELIDPTTEPTISN